MNDPMTVMIGEHGSLDKQAKIRQQILDSSDSVIRQIASMHPHETVIIGYVDSEEVLACNLAARKHAARKHRISRNRVQDKFQVKWNALPADMVVEMLRPDLASVATTIQETIDAVGPDVFRKNILCAIIDSDKQTAGATVMLLRR